MENLRERTSTEQEATHADLLHNRERVENTPIKGIAAHTHSGYPPTKNADTVVLESLIYVLPDQAGPNHSGARSRIVRHLGELSGVNMNSLCRRKSGICSMTTARHLRHQGVTLDY